MTSNSAGSQKEVKRPWKQDFPSSPSDFPQRKGCEAGVCLLDMMSSHFLSQREHQDPCGHRLIPKPVTWLGYSGPFSVQSFTLIRMTTSSVQPVRNVVTISPSFTLGWKRAQFSHLPAEAIVQSNLRTAPNTACFLPCCVGCGSWKWSSCLKSAVGSPFSMTTRLLPGKGF